MEQNKFFKLIWRINALAICIASLGAVLFILIGGLILIVEMRYYDTPPPVADTTENANTLEGLRLNIPYSPAIVEPYTYFELKTGKESTGSLSYSKSQIRNIAIVNLETGLTKWVFDGLQQEIESYEKIGKSIQNTDGHPEQLTTGLLLTVATSQRDMSVVRHVWVMKPNGDGLSKVIEGVTGEVDIQRFGKDQVRIIIETKNNVEIYPLDVDTLTIGEPSTVSFP
jgi:hypothetical protein